MFTLESKNLEDEEKDNPVEEWDSEMRAAEKGNWINKKDKWGKIPLCSVII